jgi:hypothetical protein
VTRRLASLCTLAISPLLLCIATPASAANDGEALKLSEAAIFQDYLNLNFDAAEQKLNKAIEMCASDCRPATKAKVLRDLGVLYVAGMQKRAEGVAKFQEALAADPTITLDKDLSTPDLEAAFEEAKAGGSGNPALDAAIKGSVVPDEEAAPATTEEQPVLTESPEEKPVETKPAEPIHEEPQHSHARAVKTDAEDCPPDFPGCNSVDHSGEEEEEDAGSKHKAHWLSLGFQQDFLLMTAAKSVCAGTDYQCFRGAYYTDPSTTGTRLSDGTVSGAGDVKSGPAMATMRVMAGYDYAVTPEILLGLRGGFAFGGGPERGGIGSKKFMPVHAELRAAYWFTSVTSGTVRPFIELSGGVAEIDAKMSAKIIDQGPAQVNSCTAMGQGTDPRCYVVPADVWRKTGTGFVGGGLGALFAVGESHGVVVEARAMQMLGASATGLGAEIGYALGL